MSVVSALMMGKSHSWNAMRAHCTSWPYTRVNFNGKRRENEGTSVNFTFFREVHIHDVKTTFIRLNVCGLHV